jgi:hypothetical protein
MRWSIAVLFVAVGTLSVSADDELAWKVFSSAEGHTKVLMPGTPTGSAASTLR